MNQDTKYNSINSNKKSKRKGTCKQCRNIFLILVVSGTIAPSLSIPDLTAEDTIRLILSNLNLLVPTVVAVLVIIIFIIVICVLRSKGNNNKGIYQLETITLRISFPFCSQYFIIGNIQVQLRLLKNYTSLVYEHICHGYHSGQILTLWCL